MAMSVLTQPKIDLKHPDKLFIGGEWVGPSSTSMIDVINPATEEVSMRVVAAQPADMERAIVAAREAFDKGPWPRMSPAERAGYLRKFADALRAQPERLGAIQSYEMGILFSLAKYGPDWAAARFDYYAGLADEFTWIEHHKPVDGGEFGLLVREPVGVVGSIIPWNGPLTITAFKVAPALLAGCTIILKAAPEAPGEAYVLAEIAEEIGLPPGVLNVVTADREVSELLVQDSRVDKIAFTGSTAAGRRIGSIVGGRVGRLTLELGGKSAAIILDDFDLEEAANTIAMAATRLTGQACSCLSRIIVPRKRHDDMVEALAAVFNKVRVGNPFDAEVDMGPVVSQRQRDRILQFMAMAKQEGAQLVCGGGRPAHLDKGWFVEPTVYGNVDNASTIAREEVFGPVLSVIAVDDDSQAVDVANDSIYGLNSSVFSNDIERVYQMGRRLQSGTVGHNAFRGGDFTMAFGGFKQSGVGREGGVEGLLPYLETKTMLLDALPAKLS
jgi:acyl-CoA reductase-like NAD-dependent aldehyde dehydrogenase